MENAHGLPSGNQHWHLSGASAEGTRHLLVFGLAGWEGFGEYRIAEALEMQPRPIMMSYLMDGLNFWRNQLSHPLLTGRKKRSTSLLSSTEQIMTWFVLNCACVKNCEALALPSVFNSLCVSLMLDL
ncbi:unnamed protein product [Notodromas monacha]|uniref:Uncharacterized protein n=1 Tax=Notodromas monacha TaxID=399045 RepID=A0A7R9GJB0_9CRUS|nr:unnamed protein product [Notodromas monacha]CAG0923454.1 unnamed protein product [Notodromas monacha]